jgi:hypothetical protein
MPSARRPSRRTRWSRSSVSGGTPLPLPIVSTVGATVTATGATIIGAVNPQGYAGTVWATYGTTPAYGAATTPQSITTATHPVTITAQLTGLTTGIEYWAAIVCQTAAGTVTATPVTIIAATGPQVTNASIPLTSTATPAVTTPHFAFPFQMTSQGCAVVEQDSYDEVISCVQAITVCEIGECPELPTFGIPDLAFQQGPPSTGGLVAAVQRWEPLADETTVTQMVDPTGSQWAVELDTTIVGTGQ